MTNQIRTVEARRAQGALYEMWKEKKREAEPRVRELLQNWEKELREKERKR